MRQRLADLFEVQKIDLGVRELEKQREDVPRKLNELDEAIGALLGDVEMLVTERTALETEIKALEGNVQAENAKLRKWEKRLLELRNQREYLALSREVEGARRANRETEEKILELMTRKEELDGQLAEKKDDLTHSQEERQVEEGEVENALAKLDTEISGEKTRRQELTPQLPKQLLSKYDFIRAKRMGIGLVAAANGCCTGCNMRLPPQLYNVLQRVDSIEQCPTCQRIMYFEEGVFPPDPAEGAEGTAVEVSP